MLPAVAPRSAPAARSSEAAAAAATRADLEEEGNSAEVGREAAPPGLGPLRELPSIGSALHVSGACQPCGWFWKAGGCQNGHECTRCHLCPEGELKSRKKAKHKFFRLGLATPKVDVAGTAGEKAKPHHARFVSEIIETSEAEVEVSPIAADVSASGNQPGEMVGTITVELVSGGETAPSQLGGEELDFPPGLAPCGSSKLHGTGACQPWGLVAPKAPQCTRSVTFGEEMVAMLSNPESDVESTSAGGSAEELGTGAGSEADVAAEREAPGARSSDGSVLPVPPGLQPPPETPSHGSTLHRSGACQPCNWFWKPGGCQNGAGCGYCHLCPESETKDRKRSKHAQMRLGLVTPRAQHQRQAEARGRDSALCADAPAFTPGFFGPVTERIGLVTPKAPCQGPFDWQNPDFVAGKFGMELPICCGA